LIKRTLGGIPKRRAALSQKTDAEIIGQVTEYIDAAVGKNRRSEYVVMSVLVVLIVAGLSFVAYGAASQRWELLAPGGLAQLLVWFPVRKLIQLREDNMRLQILPQLMRLAESKEAKALAAKLVQRLIEKV
jgi:hypothetical protein